MRLSNGGANGIFVDYLRPMDMTNCVIPRCGEGKDECCVWGKDDQQSFEEAHVASIAELR